MKVNKDAFIKQMMEKYRYTKASATEAVNDVLDLILDNLTVGNTVLFHGVGSFAVLKRAERHCVDPNDRTPRVSPEHLIPRFYPGATMRRAVKTYESNLKKGLI